MMEAEAELERLKLISAKTQDDKTLLEMKVNFFSFLIKSRYFILQVWCRWRWNFFILIISFLAPQAHWSQDAEQDSARDEGTFLFIF